MVMYNNGKMYNVELSIKFDDLNGNNMTEFKYYITYTLIDPSEIKNKKFKSDMEMEEMDEDCMGEYFEWFTEAQSNIIPTFS